MGITGICGTDAAEFAHGPRMFPIETRHPASGHRGPMVPGHEFAGRVVELGEGVTDLAVGDEVATGAGVWCGECDRCRSGRPNLCTAYWTLGLQRDGGLAQYCAVPAITCVRAGGLRAVGRCPRHRAADGDRGPQHASRPGRAGRDGRRHRCRRHRRLPRARARPDRRRRRRVRPRSRAAQHRARPRRRRPRSIRGSSRSRTSSGSVVSTSRSPTR